MADNELVVSKYADNLEHVDSGRKISSDPKAWVCEDSGKTENLWLNLSTGNIRNLCMPFESLSLPSYVKMSFLSAGRYYNILCTVLCQGTSAPVVGTGTDREGQERR